MGRCRTESLLQRRANCGKVMPEEDWVIVCEFGRDSAMIRESQIECDGTQVRVPVRYVFDPPALDKRNGRAIAEWTMFEEYDLEKSLFRADRIACKYVGGGSSEWTLDQVWNTATAGNEETLLVSATCDSKSSLSA